ncbi:putative acetyltransferase [Lederbergia galactosidilyticus]|uniref:GNAT family N-acetyltransferase n=1 Tax=Lederbergia galactosidilytica TaxID=217031 RepID=UPI001AE5F6A0|nr:GNAT family N-acetyltransferase [Lederbergia galactosidilytica]MBP1916213.1 putative acetyltransferase [Lederbergia galactosidilytica]
MNPSIEIRTIQTEKELEQALDLWEQVFPENRQFFEKRLKLEPQYNKQTTWIAKVDGELAASVQLFPYYTYLEQTLVKVGGIGNVATLPAFRGLGLTHTILNRQTEWMKQNGFDLSLLSTDINPFYEKVGWHTFPETPLRLKEIPRIPSTSYTVKEFSVQDFEAVKSLYNNFSLNLVGPRVRTSSYWQRLRKELLQWSKEILLVKDGKETVAYLIYNGDKVVNLEECVYQAGDEEAILALLGDIKARKHNIESICFNGACSHALYKLLLGWKAEKTQITTNMWKIIDKKSLLLKLRDVFTQRMARYGAHIGENHTIFLQCGEMDLLIKNYDGIVDIGQPSHDIYYNEQVKCSEAELIKWLLNGGAAKEIEAKSHLFQALFGNSHYQFWSMDSF